MKKLWTILPALVLFISVNAFGQVPDNVKSYAVIGVFNLQQNASRYASFYGTKSLNTKVRKNNFNNVFYVYVDESEDVEAIRNKVLNVREQYAALNNAWLYNGNFNCLHIPSDQLKRSESNSIGSSMSNAKSTMAYSDIEETEAEEGAKQKMEAEPVSAPKSEKPATPKVEKPEGKYWVYFNTYNETDLTEVEGNVAMEDAERGKELGKYPTQQLVTLSDPRNGTRKVKFESDVFGYRVTERKVDLDDPEQSESIDEITILGDSIVVDMPMKRYNKGDYMTMWNVYFYIDAAIMKEESVLELNQLLDLMRENESIRIKIHGHTNGNSHGVVKHLDLDDKSFFSLNGSHLEDKASAKKLSEFRAYTIQHWLMDQGIGEDRMEIQGWGGKKMLYDKHGANADKNVRVEIEILEE